MRWFIRDYHDDDLESVVRLVDATSAHQGSVFGLAEVITALRDDQPAVVAQRDDEVVGAVVSTVSGDRAWVVPVEADLTEAFHLQLLQTLRERHARS